MEKSEVLKLFLEKGYQIDIESLNFFSKNKTALEKFLAEMKSEEMPATITLTTVNQILQADLQITNLEIDKKTITAEELSRILMEKFTKIKKILIAHLDLVNLLSISKINQKLKKFSIIGIVSAIDDASNTITISDDTGEIELHADKKLMNEILIYDVLGFICEKNDATRILSIVLPDVPLKRFTKTLTFGDERKIVFANNIGEKIVDFLNKETISPTVFHFSEWNKPSSANAKNIFLDGGPVTATIANNFTIFLFDGNFLQKTIGDKKQEEFLISLFKKRYFNATNTLDKHLINNGFVLENIPDIVVINGLAEATQVNYKGTTILTLDENTSWIVNLKTREIIKLSTS